MCFGEGKEKKISIAAWTPPFLKAKIGHVDTVHSKAFIQNNTQEKRQTQ
jgi:hypothetical protein